MNEDKKDILNPLELEGSGTSELDVVQEKTSSDAAVAEKISPENKAKAYELFLSTSRTPEDIALEAGVPGFVLFNWIAKERWAERKASFEMQLFKRLELEHQRFIMDHRLDTAKRQLIAATLLEQEVLTILEGYRREREKSGDEYKPGRGHDMTLVRLSTALKNSTDISSRVVGITDKPPLSESEAAKTIIMIGGQPQGRAPSVTVKKGNESINIGENKDADERTD